MYCFFGGISENYDSNFLLSNDSNYLVVEADEYDKSFLTLNPDIAVITSLDADHLDIYDSHQEFVDIPAIYPSDQKKWHINH